MERLVERRLNTISFRVFMIVTMGLFSAVCFAQLAAPQVSIGIVTIDDVDYVRVKWEAVDDALSYNIYASEIADPEEWGAPIARVGANVFEYDVPVNDDRVKLFYVTASEVPPPAGMVFVQGTVGVQFNPGGPDYFTPATNYHVSLSSFYISKYEVTQSEWTSVMGGIYDPDWTDRGQGLNHPAYRISWFDAIEYCNRRSLMEGLTPCYSYDGDTNPDDWPAHASRNHLLITCNWEASGYRLPTEMEREYAMRGGVPAATAGTPTFNHTYAGTNVAGTGAGQLGDYAWYSVNSNSMTHPVGTKLPNELGLYDMSGNVWNWVWDRRDGGLPTGTVTDPKGKDSGTLRVLRGGYWLSVAAGCAVSHRNFVSATDRSNPGVGFRCVRRVD